MYTASTDNTLNKIIDRHWGTRERQTLYSARFSIAQRCCCGAASNGWHRLLIYGRVLLDF